MIVLALVLALLVGLASFAIASATWSSTQTSRGLVNAWSAPVPTLTATPTPPPAVGGIVELRRDPSAVSAHQADTAARPYIPLAGAAAAGAMAVAAGAWYARRRWLR